MAVVRGDRIGESTALNSVSREAQTFYSAFVAAVPDAASKPWEDDVPAVTEPLYAPDGVENEG